MQQISSSVLNKTWRRSWNSLHLNFFPVAEFWITFPCFWSGINQLSAISFWFPCFFFTEHCVCTVWHSSFSWDVLLCVCVIKLHMTTDEPFEKGAAAVATCMIASRLFFYSVWPMHRSTDAQTQNTQPSDFGAITVADHIMECAFFVVLINVHTCISHPERGNDGNEMNSNWSELQMVQLWYSF